MSIRKEISVLCGFPIVLHTVYRIISVLFKTFNYMLEPALLEKETIYSMFGFIMYQTGYILGIVMTVLFLILWVTSFAWVEKRLGKRRWKKIQKWAYVLYALLFIHSFLLNVGWYINQHEDRYKLLINMVVVTLIFASYLYLRLKKAGSDKARRDYIRQRIKLQRTPTLNTQ